MMQCAAMDDLPPEIAAILAVDETGSQFFTRVAEERVLTGIGIIDYNLVLRPGVVLEVSGPASSGKTEVLLSTALHVLLAPYADPRAWVQQQNHHPQQQQYPPQGAASHAQGGWQQGQRQQGQGQQDRGDPVGPHPPGSGQVVVFDLDGKFDGVRLMQLLTAQVDSMRQERMRQHHTHPQHQHHQLHHGTPPPGSGPGPPGAWPAAAAGPGQHPAQGPTQVPHTGPGGAPRPGVLSAVHTQQLQLLSAEALVDEVLSRLHLVRCHSSVQLLAALVALPGRLDQWKAQGCPCRLLLLDNVGAHYWRDRAARVPLGPHYQQQHHPQQQRQGQQQAAPLALSVHEVHAALAARLEHACRSRRLALLATKYAAVTPAGRGAGDEGDWGGGGAGEAVTGLRQREYMPKAWQDLVTHRLLLLPQGVRRGAAGPGGGATQGGGGGAVPLTCILAEWQGRAAAGGGAGAGGPVAGGGGGGGSRQLGRLLVSGVALSDDW